ncbi:putative FMN-dependent luciferase-like monooxygenase [Sinorhizobium americanum]|uniref:Alkanal monooxygenase alpha chain n=1 Tax=Sinorhizobium americanum TaxID=194963 RepID=A0A1L3LSX5_9HYPH|nr:putative FMN-dependent luciferase-like monooxygenase [Sinorhizobium americanum]APG93163.1 alkanal monooxygenase alpha chain [Sinorhizobium americanum]OAP45747.1 luciferase [Sinorhizobium americanum]
MTKTPSRKRLGFFTRVLDDTTAGVRYRLAAEQIAHAERFGFDSAWVAQHHFHADEGGLPAPLVFLAHLAAQTSRIRLGTGVITLPLENPIRVSEDTAVLDLLSRGRLEVGFGTGGTPSSFAAFGLDSGVRGEIFARHLKIVLDAWSGLSLEGGDRLYPAAPDLVDRVWQATFSVQGGERAGKTGDGLMLSRTQPRPADRLGASLADLQNPIIDAYLDALPERRAPRILGSRSLFVADSRAEALRFAEIGLRRGAERLIAAGHKVEGDTLADLIRAFDVHVGTPEDVIASLSADATLDRVTDLVFQVHSVDPPHPLILRSIELVATKVAPALGWAPERPAETRRIGSVG